MATLALSAVGTLVGGPLGGALGAMAGRAIDGTLFGAPAREGPRLAELAVSTSSYGQPIARVHGTMRGAGSIIWATDLVEHSDTQGAKGQPKTTTFSYSASFAVALSSRPIVRLGRVWADGNLLRGAAGDLKTGGTLRVHTGHADQQPDVLIASAKGAQCPGFRGLAYAVFEDLQLADFGNRIPALSFEIVGDSGAVALVELAEGLSEDTGPVLDRLSGYSLETAPAVALEQIARLIPLDCESSGEDLRIAASGEGDAIALRDPAMAVGEDRVARRTGQARRRLPPAGNAPAALRYYDLQRDYQPGQQRAAGPVASGQPQVIELPATLTPDAARTLIGETARRHRFANELRVWRDAALDPALRPGAVVTIPSEPGQWRVAGWEWRSDGVELELTGIAAGEPGMAEGDGGAGIAIPDLPLPPTRFWALELPWNGYGDRASADIRAVLSAENAQWSGAALYAVEPDGALRNLGASGRNRAVAGTVELPPGEGSPFQFDRTNRPRIRLLDPAFGLTGATPEQLAYGANRAMLGEEIVQFAHAEPLGDGLYELSGLLRGRGGTEHRIAEHLVGEPFVLLESGATGVDPALLAGADVLAAIGQADTEPSLSPVLNHGIATRPLCPVHPRHTALPDGGNGWRWTRRSRGAWAWRDEVDVALNEQSEAYEVGFGHPDAILSRWDVTSPAFSLDGATVAALLASRPDGQFFVRQRGDHALSLALLLPRS